MGSNHLKIQTILFDLDGTLIDSEKTAARVMNESFAEIGIILEPLDATFVTGRTWASALNFLYDKYSISISKEEALKRVSARYQKAMETCLEIIPGSVGAVKALASEFELGLVSGSLRKEILWALDRLGIRNYFKVILGAEDYPMSKPAPDGYLKALTLLAAEAEQTLIFEDSEAGIESGRSAGAYVTAVLAANHFGHDVSRAHFQIRDLTQVHPQWVRELKTPKDSG